MIDLHCHILPTVDDGAQTLDESLRMARFCVADGITTVVATPHCHRFVHLLRADIVPKVVQLNNDLQKAEIPLTILPGSEIQVVDTKAFRDEYEENVFCHLGDCASYSLIEFNWSFDLFPRDAVGMIEWLIEKDVTPIIAHPERMEYFAKAPEYLESMVSAGAWLQVTVDSLLGNHGQHPREYGEQYLRRFPNSVLATDAHNMKRCSGMAAGYTWVGEQISAERSADLRERADQIEARLCAQAQIR
jgi:protein-tyrosine phosphatase